MEYSRILIDTSIFIEYLRKKNKKKTHLFKIPDPTIIVISAITLEFRDIFIAATAITKKIPIKTLNKKHFIRINNLVVL